MASGAVPAAVRKLRGEGMIKKDDVVVGILTGRQKDPGLAVQYHINANNMFARPPTSN
jgi:threonine synthase